eukprot:638361-Prymnesium_polylepis.1
MPLPLPLPPPPPSRTICRGRRDGRTRACVAVRARFLRAEDCVHRHAPLADRRPFCCCLPKDERTSVRLVVLAALAALARVDAVPRADQRAHRPLALRTSPLRPAAPPLTRCSTYYRTRRKARCPIKTGQHISPGRW